MLHGHSDGQRVITSKAQPIGTSLGTILTPEPENGGTLPRPALLWFPGAISFTSFTGKKIILFSPHKTLVSQTNHYYCS